MHGASSTPHLVCKPHTTLILRMESAPPPRISLALVVLPIAGILPSQPYKMLN